MEELDELVKCEFYGRTFYITHEVLSEVLLRMQLRCRHLYSYKDAACLYGISESETRLLAKKAGAVRKFDGGAYVDSSILDSYIEKQVWK